MFTLYKSGVPMYNLLSSVELQAIHHFLEFRYVIYVYNYLMPFNN